MNKKLYTLCAIAAAFVLAGCQKENNQEATTYVGPTHTVTFTAEKMIDTKTAIDTEGNGVVSYKWIEGDEERMHITESYTDGENTVKNGTTSIAMALSNDDKVATFTVTFAGNAPEGEVTYNAVYAGSVSGSGNPLIPATQNPLQNSFDPLADVLVADPIVKQVRDASPSLKFNMTRKVSVNKITLKGLTPNETISTVTFESDKQHSAYYVPGTGNYSPNGTKLTFTFTTNNTVPASGEFPVYFTTAPVTDATFTVKVTTNAAIYEKTGASTISFAVGSVRRFGMNLSGYRTPITAGTVYTLVESNSDIVDGADYLIVGSYNSVYKAMAAQRTNNRGASEELTIDNNTITIDNSSEAHIFTLLDYDTDGFVFQDKSDNTYLYGDGANGNYLKSDASINSSSYWTINVDASSHHAIITNNNNDNSAKPYLKYNQSGLFSCYGSSSTGTHYVYLYVSATSGGKLNSGLSFTTPSYAFVLGDSNYSSFTGQTLNNPNSLTGITWASDNTSLATVSNGTVSLVANATGTATITASFAGNDTYKAGSASYTITVTAPATGLTLPFEETFDGTDGTMGWSGSVASGNDIHTDNDGWEFDPRAYGASDAIKLGTSTAKGSATTPEITHTGTATLTFDAGAWSGDQTTLSISSSSGAIYSDYTCTNEITEVTIPNEAWATKTVYLSGISGSFQITFQGKQASKSRFFLDNINIVSGIETPAAAFSASISNTDNVLAAGGTKTINITANVAWTASVTGGATISPASGTGDGTVTVTIPANANSSTASYTATVSTTASVSPNSYSFTITQDAKPSVVNESSEADPYTPAEAAALADELSGGTMDDVYVYGIISKIITAYDSQYGNVTFDISIDGKDTGSQQFRIFRTAATSADDYVVGDAVEFKGTLTKYNSTYELAQGSTLIAQLHKPSISPNGGSFTTSQTVSITAASGSTIRYTTNGNDPTASSSIYSSALNLTATTTVKAIAIKGILTTGVASAVFTKSSGGTVKKYVKVTSGTIGGEYLIVRESSKYIYDGSLSNPDDANNYKTASDLSSLNYDDWKNYAVTIETYSTGYSIKTAAGNYIGRNANSNGIDSSTTLGANFVNTISFANNGTVTILGKGGRKFNFNNSSGKFRYFASGNTTEIYLYQLQEVSN